MSDLTSESVDYVLLRDPIIPEKRSHFYYKRTDIDILVTEKSYSSLTNSKLITRNPFKGSIIIHIKTPLGEINNTRAYEYPDFPINLSLKTLKDKVIDYRNISVPHYLDKFILNCLHLIYHNGIDLLSKKKN